MIAAAGERSAAVVRTSCVPAASTVARAGLAAFVGAVALEHVLRPDLPPATRFISEYGRGWTQPLHVAAFLGWAATSGACAVLAARARPRPVARALTAAGFGVAALGTLMAAAFATETVGGELPAGAERTAGGRLHDLGTLLILGGLLVAALASLRLVQRRAHRVAVAVLAVVLLAIVPVMTRLGLDAPGIGQRAFVLVGCALQWSFARHAGAPAAARA